MQPFTGLAAGSAIGAALWVGAAPVEASIATVFLFAGPHNWMEARYFLARLPSRWGITIPFFTTAAAGALLLGIGQALLAWYPDGLPYWNVSLCGWAALLWMLLARERRSDGFGAIPLACLIAAIGVKWPFWFAMAMVYVHPLVALWFLDRQIRVSRPEWLPAWRRVMVMVPLCILALTGVIGKTPLQAADPLTGVIAMHAGSLATADWSRLLVSVHVFLETLHYLVWIVALPLIGLSVAPWKLPRPAVVRGVLWFGLFAAVVLWIAFSIDYAATRQVYFTIAIIHVLAEVPFLMRLPR